MYETRYCTGCFNGKRMVIGNINNNQIFQERLVEQVFVIEEQFLIAFAYGDLGYTANAIILLGNVFDIEEVGHENAAARRYRGVFS